MKALTNSISRLIAVLNRRASKSSVTAATVRATILACSAVGATSWTRGSRRDLGRLGVHDHPPGPAQEPVNAFDALHAPGLDGLERSHEHLVKPQAIGAVLGDHGVGIDHVAPALRHLVGPGVDADVGVARPVRTRRPS